jgi:hypothetical protein
MRTASFWHANQLTKAEWDQTARLSQASNEHSSFGRGCRSIKVLWTQGRPHLFPSALPPCHCPLHRTGDQRQGRGSHDHLCPSNSLRCSDASKSTIQFSSFVQGGTSGEREDKGCLISAAQGVGSAKKLCLSWCLTSIRPSCFSSDLPGSIIQSDEPHRLQGRTICRLHGG